MMRYATGLILLACCVAASGAGTTKNSALGLTAVAPSSPDGTFRIGQPVWVSLLIVNREQIPVAIRVDGSPDQGVSVAVDPPSSADKRSRDRYIDVPYAGFQLGASQKHSVEVLLNDFVTPRVEGEVSVDIGITVYEVKDGKAQEVELHAPLKLLFKGRVDATNIVAIIEPLRQRYEGDEKARYAVIRQIASFDPQWRPLDILKSALLGADDRAAAVAIEALRSIDSEPAREALRQGIKGSRYAFVRQECERALQKR